MGETTNYDCVRGSQGSPAGPDRVAEIGSSTTLGRTMERRSAAPAAFRVTFQIAIFALLAVLGLHCGRVYAAESAKSFYKRGQTAEARQDYDAAYQNYQKAYSMSPKDLSYRTALYRTRLSAATMHVTRGHKLLNAGDQQGALVEFLRAAEIDPGDEEAGQQIARIRARSGQQVQAAESSLPEAPGEQSLINSMGSPVVLKPLSNEPLSLHMVEDSKIIYQAVGKAAGINVLFDPDYVSKRIQVDLNNVSLLDALRILGTVSNTFWRPVTSNTVFVAQNSRAKRTELEEEAVQTFYLSNAWQQNDLNDVQTALRNVLPTAHVYGVASQNAIVMRGTPDELLLAQKLIDDLDRARPEVVVDIAVLEVSKNWEQTLGIQWPTSASVQLQPPTSTSNTAASAAQGGTTTNPTLYNLAHLNATDFSVSIGQATANLLLTDSNTKILQNPRIRATDQQKATMKIGQRIPIATGSYQTGAATALVSSLVNTQFQYQDVGVNIEMTPTIHYDRDITLKMKIEVSSVAGYDTISGVTEPIIAQHTVDHVIRLHEGEASVLGGILDQQETVSWNGVPGLSSIPLVKYLFGSKDHTITNDEIVFLVIPHIVRSSELSPLNLRPIDTGTGQAIELRHISAVTQTPVALPARPATVEPGLGTVPGQTAQAAAPAALDRLRASAEANPAIGTPPAPPGAQPAAQAGPQQAERLTLSLNSPSAPVAVGSTVQIPVVLTGGANIAAVPMQIQYDPSKLSLVNVSEGDFLNRDGQAVALVHRDDGPGNITLNASRPPGAPGVSGAGVVCVLSFQAKAAGTTAVTITRPGAVSSSQQPVQVLGTLPATVVVK
jgi:general secretion pathway protein D